MKSLLLKNNEEIRSYLGEKIKRARIDHEYSQTELALRSGVSVHSISNIENGKDFSVDNLISILRALSYTDNLDLLIPDIAPNPYDLMKGIKERKRAIRRN